jgi:hypothetical protein
MSTNGPAQSGGLTAFDAAKIIGIIVGVLVALYVIGKIIGAIMSLIYIGLVAVAVVAAGWVLWSLMRGGKGS